MIQIETLMAVAGALLLVSVFANRISVFLGIPGLLIFIGIGMLAGSDGIVRIQFYDARMTNYIGTVALAFILFAGGLDTRWRDVRPVLAGGSLLATLGVVLTALFLFLPAYYVLRLELPVALLLGVIVSSTDAPAVFMIMRTQKAELRYNQAALLARELGRYTGLPVDCFSLVRHRKTRPQVEFSGFERVRNVKNAFSVPHPEKLAGKRVVLIDDVLTTGSTLKECAAALKKAGVRSVDALTVARVC